MEIGKFDNSSDAYINLRDHLENFRSVFVAEVSRAVMDRARAVEESDCSLEGVDASVFFTLQFEAESACGQVVAGEKGVTCVELNCSDIRYLVARDTMLNRAVAQRIAESLIEKTIKYGVTWSSGADSMLEDLRRVS